MAECRSCHAPIRFVFTAMGGRIPLDAEPVDDGNIVLRGNTAHIVKSDDEIPTGEPRYTSHLATCADAERWRKKKASRR